MSPAKKLRGTGGAGSLEKRDLADYIMYTQKESRHIKLVYLEEQMNNFMDWFIGVYKLRSAGKHEEYEKAISDKYEEILSLDKKKGK